MPAHRSITRSDYADYRRAAQPNWAMTAIVDTAREHLMRTAAAAGPASSIDGNGSSAAVSWTANAYPAHSAHPLTYSFSLMRRIRIHASLATLAVSRAGKFAGEPL